MEETGWYLTIHHSPVCSLSFLWCFVSTDWRHNMPILIMVIEHTTYKVWISCMCFSLCYAVANKDQEEFLSGIRLYHHSGWAMMIRKMTNTILYKTIPKSQHSWKTTQKCFLNMNVIARLVNKVCFVTPMQRSPGDIDIWQMTFSSRISWTTVIICYSSLTLIKWGEQISWSCVYNSFNLWK